LWFTLTTPGLELKIGLEEIGKVRIHEEIIPELLEKLASAIKSDGVAKHPVIVDSNTLVVLDGMHRVAALERLGCKYLPVCLVDYQSSGVKVGCWHRAIERRASVDELLAVIRALGIALEESQLERAVRMLDARGAPVVLRTRGRCYLAKGASGGIRESYALVKRIERALVERGFGVSYETEDDAAREVQSGKAIAALLTPRVTKDEVVEAALSGRVFAHKTTRHVITARPMNVDVPLDWLMGGESLEKINRMFIDHLSRRKVRRLPKGAMFEGRRYEEELLVFQ